MVVAAVVVFGVTLLVVDAAVIEGVSVSVFVVAKLLMTVDLTAVLV